MDPYMQEHLRPTISSHAKEVVTVAEFEAQEARDEFDRLDWELRQAAAASASAQERYAEVRDEWGDAKRRLREAEAGT